MKLLVTGSSGLVGSACMSFFKKKRWDVSGIDSNMRSAFFDTPLQDVDRLIDIRDEDSISALFKEEKFDAVIHAAAQPSHDWSTNHALIDFDINARGTLILLEAMRKHSPLGTFVYVSTDKVYGENMKTNLIETHSRYDAPGFNGFDESLGLDFAGDRSLFGCSKAAADMYVQEYGNRFGMKTACFRPGCITGLKHQGAEFHGFLAYLAKCIKSGVPYKVFGHKGKQVRDQIHAHDLSSAFWHFIQNPKVAAVYNIGGGPERSVSVLEAGAMIRRTVGRPWTYEIHEARKGDRIWDVHDVSKFRADYPDWDYEYSLDDIINDVCSKV